MAAGRLLPVLLLLLGVPGGPGLEPPDPQTGPAALAARCRLPALTGRCRASIPRWFFNASSGTCEGFVFGGCGGNGNNFGSERECRESCGGAPLPSPAATNSTFAERCAAPPVPGPCRAAFPRWYYSPAEGSCREFTYGGCRGNANNHRDERECLRRCRPRPDDPGSEFRKFFSSKGAVLGGLLAAGALLGSGVAAGLLRYRRRRRRRRRSRAGPGSGREDRECLMKDPYPA